MPPIEFLAPHWFYALAALPLVCAVPSVTGARAVRRVIEIALRVLVLAALVVALARPSWSARGTRVVTVALVDVSDSISDVQLDAARRYLDELSAGGEVKLVTFAARPRVASAIARHDGAGTDIQAAMQLAYGLYPDDCVPRMVIVSDGNETAGDVAVEAYRAHELGVRVSWRAFDAPQVPEVRVTQVTLPDDLEVGRAFDVTATIASSVAQRVTLALDRDGKPDPIQATLDVALRAGTNRIALRSEATHAGPTTYTVRIATAEHDREPRNNRAVATAAVRGRARVLYVDGSGASRDLPRALASQGFDVDVRGPAGLPRELAPYDLVFAADVDLDQLGDARVAALDAYVHSGGGLVVAGGDRAPGYAHTPLEAMMPVRFVGHRDREQPAAAVALVIDRSGSMTGAKLEAAEASANATAAALRPMDSLAVIAFDTEASVIVPMMHPGDRDAIAQAVSSIAVGNGTNILPALVTARDELARVDARIKHVIVLTDGEAPPEGLLELAGDMRADGITVSCVGIGLKDAGHELLDEIARAGGGRSIPVDDLRTLPRLIVADTVEAERGSLVEGAIRVAVVKPVEALEGTAIDTAPPLRGYVSALPRPTGETVLAAAGTGEPLLARWRWGAGTVVAWTSDVDSRWAADWLRWPGYARLWAQVVRTSMRGKAYGSYDLVATAADGRVTVTVDAIDGEAFVNDLDTELRVVDPGTGAVVRTLPMAQTAAGRYTADFALGRYGSFLLDAVHTRNGVKVAESLGSVALSYPLEYLRTTPDTTTLAGAAYVTGGADGRSPAAVWDPREDAVDYAEDLWPYVLIGVVALFLLDLCVKRLPWGYRTMAG